MPSDSPYHRRQTGIQYVMLPYRSLAKLQRIASPPQKQFNSSSQGALQSDQMQIHTPRFVYPRMDYPHDHVHDRDLRGRLRVLVPMEKRVIASLSQFQSFRKEYYANCFKSLIPLSENGSQILLTKSHDNVYLGVRRNAKGDCEGCPLAKPIRYSNNRKPIRKFVGNREVFNTMTKKNGVSLFSLSS